MSGTTRLAHLSDLHFGRTDPRLIGPLRDELVRACPDLVVVSGDLTLAARDCEFAAAAAFLHSLPAPCFVVPGNHDIPSHRPLERMLDPFRRWRRHFGPDLEPVRVEARVALVGFNSVRRASWRINWSHGRIGRRQLARLEQRLATLPAEPVRIVVGHHPFFVPETRLRSRIVSGSERALAIFRRHRVRLVLAGHLHRAFVHECHDESGTAMLVVHGGTSVSTRLRGEPNAFNLIDVDDDGGVQIEGRAWSGESWVPRQAPVQRLPSPSSG